MDTRSFLGAVTLLTALVSASLTAGCASTDGPVDEKVGKVVYGLDIGGELALDRGMTQQMVVTVEYDDGTTTEANANDVTWQVTDPNVATISSTGLVTGLGVGTTIVRAVYQGKESASKPLIVK